MGGGGWGAVGGGGGGGGGWAAQVEGDSLHFSIPTAATHPTSYRLLPPRATWMKPTEDEALLARSWWAKAWAGWDGRVVGALVVRGGG